MAAWTAIVVIVGFVCWHHGFDAARERTNAEWLRPVRVWKFRKIQENRDA